MGKKQSISQETDDSRQQDGIKKMSLNNKYQTLLRANKLFYKEQIYQEDIKDFVSIIKKIRNDTLQIGFLKLDTYSNDIYEKNNLTSTTLISKIGEPQLNQINYRLKFQYIKTLESLYEESGIQIDLLNIGNNEYYAYNSYDKKKEKSYFLINVMISEYFYKQLHLLHSINQNTYLNKYLAKIAYIDFDFQMIYAINGVFSLHSLIDVYKRSNLKFSEQKIMLILKQIFQIIFYLLHKKYYIYNFDLNSFAFYSIEIVAGRIETLYYLKYINVISITNNLTDALTKLKYTNRDLFKIDDDIDFSFTEENYLRVSIQQICLNMMNLLLYQPDQIQNMKQENFQIRFQNNLNKIKELYGQQLSDIFQFSYTEPILSKETMWQSISQKLKVEQKSDGDSIPELDSLVEIFITFRKLMIAQKNKLKQCTSFIYYQKIPPFLSFLPEKEKNKQLSQLLSEISDFPIKSLRDQKIDYKLEDYIKNMIYYYHVFLSYIDIITNQIMLNNIQLKDSQVYQLIQLQSYLPQIKDEGNQLNNGVFKNYRKQKHTQLIKYFLNQRLIDKNQLKTVCSISNNKLNLENKFNQFSSDSFKNLTDQDYRFKKQLEQISLIEEKLEKQNQKKLDLFLNSEQKQKSSKEFLEPSKFIYELFSRNYVNKTELIEHISQLDLNSDQQKKKPSSYLQYLSKIEQFKVKVKNQNKFPLNYFKQKQIEDQKSKNKQKKEYKNLQKRPYNYINLQDDNVQDDKNQKEIKSEQNSNKQLRYQQNIIIEKDQKIQINNSKNFSQNLQKDQDTFTIKQVIKEQTTRNYQDINTKNTEVDNTYQLSNNFNFRNIQEQHQFHNNNDQEKNESLQYNIIIVKDEKIQQNNSKNLSKDQDTFTIEQVIKEQTTHDNSNINTKNTEDNNNFKQRNNFSLSNIQEQHQFHSNKDLEKNKSEKENQQNLNSQQKTDQNKQNNNAKSYIIGRLGKGGFGVVKWMLDDQNNKLYAIKYYFDRSEYLREKSNYLNYKKDFELQSYFCQLFNSDDENQQLQLEQGTCNLEEIIGVMNGYKLQSGEIEPTLGTLSSILISIIRFNILLYKRNLYHGDLKPANIIITQQDERYQIKQILGYEYYRYFRFKIIDLQSLSNQPNQYFQYKSGYYKYEGYGKEEIKKDQIFFFEMFSACKIIYGYLRKEDQDKMKTIKLDFPQLSQIIDKSSESQNLLYFLNIFLGNNEITQKLKVKGLSIDLLNYFSRLLNNEGITVNSKDYEREYLKHLELELKQNQISAESILFKKIEAFSFRNQLENKQIEAFDFRSKQEKQNINGEVGQNQKEILQIIINQLEIITTYFTIEQKQFEFLEIYLKKYISINEENFPDLLNICSYAACHGYEMFSQIFDQSKNEEIKNYQLYKDSKVIQFVITLFNENEQLQKDRYKDQRNITLLEQLLNQEINKEIIYDYYEFIIIRTFLSLTFEFSPELMINQIEFVEQMLRSEKLSKNIYQQKIFMRFNLFLQHNSNKCSDENFCNKFYEYREICKKLDICMGFDTVFYYNLHTLKLQDDYMKSIDPLSYTFFETITSRKLQNNLLNVVGDPEFNLSLQASFYQKFQNLQQQKDISVCYNWILI